jgi:hypothetical protein
MFVSEIGMPTHHYWYERVGAVLTGKFFLPGHEQLFRHLLKDKTQVEIWRNQRWETWKVESQRLAA